MNGTEILEMPASDLVGRIVINPNGADFVITALIFDARTGKVVFQLNDIDDVTGSPAGSPSGIWSLEDWTVGNRL